MNVLEILQFSFEALMSRKLKIHTDYFDGHGRK